MEREAAGGGGTGERQVKAPTTATLNITMPDDAQVGDIYMVTARAQVVLIRDVLIDVTRYGDKEPQTTSGGREYELLMSDVKIEP